MKLEDILAPYQYDLQNPPHILEMFEAELNWFGRKRNAIIAFVLFPPNLSDSYICWRFADDDGAWFLTEGGLPNRIVPIGNKELNGQKLLQKIRSAIGSKLFCRLFFLEELKQYGSVKSGFGSFYEYMSRESGSFYLAWGDIKHWKCSNTKRKFEEVLADKESDAFFALRIHRSKKSSERCLALLFDNEEIYLERYKQLEDLSKFILWSSNSLWQSDNVRWIRLFLRGIPINSFIVSSDRGATKLNDEDKQWVELINSFGPLPFNEKQIRRHLYLYSLFVLYQSQILMIHVEPPNSHERLEAKHQLLEWAKNHLPAEKYAEVEAMET